MVFKLTDKKEIKKEVEGYELLREKLYDIQAKTNYSFWKMAYDRRMSFYVGSPLWDKDTISVMVSFRSQDAEKHPDKYGWHFRKETIELVAYHANNILEDEITTLIIRVYVDDEPTEERTYERQSVEQ